MFHTSKGAKAAILKVVWKVKLPSSIQTGQNRRGIIRLKHVRYEMGMLISINMQECVRAIISDK